MYPESRHRITSFSEVETMRHVDGSSSQPRERGGKPLPWVDASGLLHLPKSYRKAVKLSPNQLGAMTAALVGEIKDWDRHSLEVDA